MLNNSEKAENQRRQQCPFCKSKKTLKKGRRKNKLQTLQRYKCSSCSKYFAENTESSLKNLTYPSKVILDAISFYNLGYTLDQTAKQLKKKHNLTITPQTILFWLKRFREQIPYQRIRKKIKKLYNPEDVIKRRIMRHHDQPFNFQYHKAKLELFCNKFPQLKEYIYKIEKDCPSHLFQNSDRISQYKQNLDIKPLKKQNYANILADLALNLTKDNKKRHEILEKFMLINDTATIAVEVPVYLNFKGKLMTGHIDIVQSRFNKIYILDFKPEAEKENPISQLRLYAIALSRRTKIPLKHFVCAYFDDKNYFEFCPII